MNTIALFNSENIRKAADEINKSKPEFTARINLYESISVEQEKAKGNLKLPEFKISREKLTVKQIEKFPVINISEFSLDYEVSEKLFMDICNTLTSNENEFSETAGKLSAIVKEKKIDLSRIFESFLNEDESFFDQIYEKEGIEKNILGFIVCNTLQPSLVSFSEKISRNLDKEIEWDRGYCPICGSMPGLSFFEENGKRFLMCGFCNHKWPSKRIYCPFCENSDHETLQYFEIDGEEEYRVDVCDKCKKYIKTIDTKKTSRTVYPPLEIHSTPYLDVKFIEMGYKHGSEKV
jgi:FdhE protein